MRSRLLIVAIGSALFLIAAVEAHGIQQVLNRGHKGTAFWLPGTGDWNDGAHWENGMVPGLGVNLPNVLIDAFLYDINHYGGDDDLAIGDRIASNVRLAIDVNIADLYLGQTDLLTVDGASLTLNRITIDDIQLFNVGEINIQPNGVNSGIHIAGGKTVVHDGGGWITLSDSNFAELIGLTGNEVFVVRSGSVQGTGMFGRGALAIVNYDTIEANLSYKRLTIEPSSAGLENQGQIRSVNRARLRLLNADVYNDGGVIEALQSSTIELNNAAIFGGIVKTDGDSSVRNLSANASMFDVTIAGNVEVGEASLTLGGNIVNNGLIICSGDTNSRGGALPVYPSRIVVPSGGAEISGTGAIDLEVGSIWSGQAGLTAPFTNAAGHTISGRGNVGNDTLCITNKGIIRADGDTSLILDPCDQTPFVNTGTLSAVGNGILFLLDGTFHNQGTIEVSEGGQIALLPGATLTNSLSGGLNGGKWIVRGSDEISELILFSIPDLTFNLADITLDGPLSRFDRINAIQYNIAGFHLLNGRVFNTVGEFDNSGLLEVDADSKLNAATRLTFQTTSHVIIGVSNNTNGKLQAESRATLNGVLEFVLEPGTTWEPGREIVFITAPQITGQFAQVIAPGPFDMHIEAGALVIMPRPACLGDLDNDGAIDVNDLVLVLDQWGACPNVDDCTADFNASGFVDVSDLLFLLALWGDCP